MFGNLSGLQPALYQPILVKIAGRATAGKNFDPESNLSTSQLAPDLVPKNNPSQQSTTC